MGDVKHLSHQEAIEKIKEIAGDIKMCLFCTRLGEKPFKTRPMTTLQVDDEGNLWFFSSKTSHKDAQIKQDDEVQLLYSDNGSSTYMTVYGTADVLYDSGKIEELWTPVARAWFPEGKYDINLEVVRVNPTDVYYWDTKHNKMVALLKIAAAAITGKTMDDGVEGKAKVQ